ncbi:MAG: DNA-directed RNA polymerase subunit D, partial [Candidatus Heimdallarchaeota archaeon]|nr:DNA-directed RNA polymerase subunit D [Candidatus Heimdallarchaeota archaeon]
MNSIRRIILGSVPTIAIDEVIMVENNTAMFDEYIAHRLGLIPLNSDIDDLNFMDACDVCDGVGCNSCTVTLTLTQETDQTSGAIIYSRELLGSDHRIYPVVDEVPIMKMDKDQRLILEAIARFGTGKEHAKWQPVGSIGYQYMPIISIRPGHTFTKDVADSCPRNVFEYDENNQSLNLRNLLDCNLCMECVHSSEEDSISVEGDSSQIIFMLESTGALPVENIVTTASDLLIDGLQSFIEGFQLALEKADNDPSSMRKISSFERIGIND